VPAAVTRATDAGIGDSAFAVQLDNPGPNGVTIGWFAVN